MAAHNSNLSLGLFSFLLDNMIGLYVCIQKLTKKCLFTHDTIELIKPSLVPLSTTSNPVGEFRWDPISAHSQLLCIPIRERQSDK